MGLLGSTQASAPSDDEVGVQDAEALARQEWERTRRSADRTSEYTSRFALAETASELQRIGAELSAAVKKEMASKDLDRVRRAYAVRLATLQTPAAAELARDGA